MLPWLALLPFGAWPSWIKGPSPILLLHGLSDLFSSCGLQGQVGEVEWTERRGGGSLAWLVVLLWCIALYLGLLQVLKALSGFALESYSFWDGGISLCLAYLC